MGQEQGLILFASVQDHAPVPPGTSDLQTAIER